MTDSLEQKLCDAAQGNSVSEVSSLLRDHPAINVNWGDDDGWTALHYLSC